MNKDQFEILRLIETSTPSKARFLLGLLLRASQGYDQAVEKDAQSLQGELRLEVVTESQGTYFGKKNVSVCRTSGGDLYSGINHQFRKFKTVNDFDWSKYGPDSLYEDKRFNGPLEFYKT